MTTRANGIVSANVDVNFIVMYCYVSKSGYVAYASAESGTHFASKTWSTFATWYNTMAEDSIIVPVDVDTALRINLIDEGDYKTEIDEGVLPPTFKAALQLALTAEKDK